MHSICTVNHTTHISYPLSCSVKQVFFPQFMVEETEAKILWNRIEKSKWGQLQGAGGWPTLQETPGSQF